MWTPSIIGKVGSWSRGHVIQTRVGHDSMSTTYQSVGKAEKEVHHRANCPSSFSKTPRGQCPSKQGSPLGTGKMT